MSTSECTLSIKNFGWVIPGVLAGSGYVPIEPTTSSSANPRGQMWPLEFLKRHGIHTVVNLTEVAHPYDDGGVNGTGHPDANSLHLGYKDYGVKGVHIPVPDYERPSYETMVEVASLVTKDGKATKAGDSPNLPVLFHCRAGIGRTNTMVAIALQALRLQQLANGDNSIDSMLKQAAMEKEACVKSPTDIPAAPESTKWVDTTSYDPSVPDVVWFLRALGREACMVPVQLEAVKEFVMRYEYSE